MANRSRNDIVVQILEFLATGSKRRTYVLYNTQLSYNQLKSYHQMLSQNGLMKEIDRKWTITEKGREYLNVCKQAQILLDS